MNCNLKSVTKIYTILQQIPFLLLWIDDHQCMELQLCVTVELFCLPVRNIFPRTSLHDLPCHRKRTTKKLLLPISLELVVFQSSSRNLGFEHISVIVHNFVFRECICADLVVTETSIHIHVRSELLPVTWSASAMCFESSCTSALFSQVALCFHRLGTSVCEMGCCGCCLCCCCWLCQFLFNVCLGAGLGVAHLSKSTRSPFLAVTRSMQSPGIVTWVMIANDFVCRNCAPWSCASSVVPNIQHLDYVSNEFHMERLLVLWVFSKTIQWC